MIERIYDLFHKNLPGIVRSEEIVKEILNDKDNRIFSFEDNGKLIGISVINENVIYLLCVDKPYHNQGYGTRLLNMSEEHIKAKGFDNVKVGVGKDYIMPGVPMNDGAHGFFKKHGYVHSWGDTGCYDMSQLLKDYAYDEHSIGDVINGITYRWADINDLDGVIRCVSDAEEEFIRYYQNEDAYRKDTNTPVLIAVKDKEVVGTLLVCIETEGKGMGTVGCTATAKRHRGQGIATNMLKLGTRHLKDAGLREAFLSYTYTDIVKMYRRAGYEICMEYFMGRKPL